MKNAAALANFKTTATERFAVIDATQELDGVRYFEFASATTEVEARARFFSRWMFRAMDREMMENAQRRGSLIVARIIGGTIETVEHNATMLALV